MKVCRSKWISEYIVFWCYNLTDRNIILYCNYFSH